MAEISGLELHVCTVNEEPREKPVSGANVCQADTNYGKNLKKSSGSSPVLFICNMILLNWTLFKPLKFFIQSYPVNLASRGLDTSWVRHVINWDFPNNVSDYLLRAGRVGRAGTNQGHVTNLVVNKSTVYTVHEVETAVRLRRRIANVDSNVKQKIRKLFCQEMVDPRNMPV